MPAAARLGGITRAHLLENPHYSLPDVSSSFHGRDVFAPAAAHLADGLRIEELGRAIDPRRLLALEWPRPDIGAGRIVTQAIYIDTFGNVKLSALAEDVAAAFPDLRVGQLLDVRVAGDGAPRWLQAAWARTFGDVAQGAPLLTVDSYGRASLAVHLGSAAGTYGVRLDSLIEMSRAVGRSGPQLAGPRPA
jgi:S-adenosylmethionine hydrolase